MSTDPITAAYAAARLAQALATAAAHDDSATRERAHAKAASWTSTLKGMLTGALSIGSRAPIASIPPWVTPKVLHGGFASGELLASGPLLPHETALAARLAIDPKRDDLNRYYLTEDGLTELRSLLESGQYRIDLPEEGALLTVTWLCSVGGLDGASAILAEIEPLFDRLRFYPAPGSKPPGRLRLQSLSQTREDLRRIAVPPQVVEMRRALQALPLYDRVVALFLETDDGSGWPCQVYPVDWHERASQMLSELPPAITGNGFRQLVSLLRTCLIASERPTGRNVGIIRQILAGFVASRGAPGSPRHTALRKQQAEALAAPTHVEIATQLLQQLTDDSPFPNVDLWPVRFARILRRSLEGELEDLVAWGCVPSSEALACLVPQLSAEVECAAFSDANLGRLNEAIYRAFSRRRSLLLLHLQGQVRLQELPWVKALAPHRSDVAEPARALLRRVVTLTLARWPHVLLPNRLLRELRTLAASAKLEVTLVDEIAADIFMGTFTEKYLRAAKSAASLLTRTLYERYFGIDYRALTGIEEASSFAALCHQRVGPTATRSPVAANGRVIEQEQILTTHNLAELWQLLSLDQTLAPLELAQSCFRQVCRQQPRREPRQRALRRRKNCAYAWRQMVFFLALLPDPEPFFLWARSELIRLKPEPRAIVARLVEELPDGPPFLGWAPS